MRRDRWRLGTRRSPLALAQAGTVAAALEAALPGLAVELVPIETRGDRLPGDLAPLGGKGLFTEELERGLLEGELDLAVHSLKDLPVGLAGGSIVGAYPPRADPRDVLIREPAGDLATLPAGTVVLTGATRRRAQILAARPDLVVEPVRGNVGTRIRRWRERDGAAIVLAAAGLARLGIDALPSTALEPGVFVPAPGQGILAVQVAVDSEAAARVAAIDDPPTRAAAQTERALVTALGGSCTLPLGAWARRQDGAIAVDAVLATPDGDRVARAAGRGRTPEEAAARCLAALRAAGADDIVAALR